VGQAGGMRIRVAQISRFNAAEIARVA